MRRTLYTHALARVALLSAARGNGTANGATVDTSVFGNDFRTVLFVVWSATITDGTHVVSVQDSDDGSTWAAAAAHLVQGTPPTIVSTSDDAVFDFGYIPARQYVRLVVTTTGATTGGVFGAVAVLSESSAAPVARA